MEKHEVLIISEGDRQALIKFIDSRDALSLRKSAEFLESRKLEGIYIADQVDKKIEEFQAIVKELKELCGNQYNEISCSKDKKGELSND